MTGIYTLDNFVENLINNLAINCDLRLVLKYFKRIPAQTELIELPLRIKLYSFNKNNNLQ